MAESFKENVANKENIFKSPKQILFPKKRVAKDSAILRDLNSTFCVNGNDESFELLEKPLIEHLNEFNNKNELERESLGILKFNLDDLARDSFGIVHLNPTKALMERESLGILHLNELKNANDLFSEEAFVKSNTTLENLSTEDFAVRCELPSECNDLTNGVITSQADLEKDGINETYDQVVESLVPLSEVAINTIKINKVQEDWDKLFTKFKEKRRSYVPSPLKILKLESKVVGENVEHDFILTEARCIASILNNSDCTDSNLLDCVKEPDWKYVDKDAIYSDISNDNEENKTTEDEKKQPNCISSELSPENVFSKICNNDQSQNKSNGDQHTLSHNATKIITNNQELCQGTTFITSDSSVEDHSNGIRHDKDINDKTVEMVNENSLLENKLLKSQTHIGIAQKHNSISDLKNEDIFQETTCVINRLQNLLIMANFSEEKKKIVQDSLLAISKTLSSTKAVAANKGKDNHSDNLEDSGRCSLDQAEQLNIIKHQKQEKTACAPASNFKNNRIIKNSTPTSSNKSSFVVQVQNFNSGTKKMNCISKTSVVSKKPLKNQCTPNTNTQKGNSTVKNGLEIKLRAHRKESRKHSGPLRAVAPITNMASHYGSYNYNKTEILLPASLPNKHSEGWNTPKYSANVRPVAQSTPNNTSFNNSHTPPISNNQATNNLSSLGINRSGSLPSLNNKVAMVSGITRRFSSNDINRNTNNLSSKVRQSSLPRRNSSTNKMK